MAKPKSKKLKGNTTWKSVAIAGNLISGSEDFEGFAGLEVLENYDSTFLTGDSKKRKDFSISEIEGETYDARKRKSNDSDEENVELDEKPTKKKSKQKKPAVDEDAAVVKPTKKKAEIAAVPNDEGEPAKKKSKKQKSEVSSAPGKYVLLKNVSLEDDVDDSSKLDEIYQSWSRSVTEETAKALVDLKFLKPTEIQQQAIVAAVSARNDILGAAPTGSGKTLAFGIPVVQGIAETLAADDENDGNLFCIILTPTRELAQQIHKHLLAISKYTSVRIACIIGGLAAVKQERILKTNPHIVIGTPGRIWELYQDGNAHLQKLTSLKYLVVDETDRMVEKGHFAELEELLQVLNASESCTKRQTFVFSATLNLIHELPEYFKKNRSKKQQTVDGKLNELKSMFGMKNPKVIDCTNVKVVAENLVECRILCNNDEKDFYLYYILLNHPGRTIVFCNSIECVKRNASVLIHLNMTPIVLHGKMEQKQRLKNLENFQKNEDSVLIATQVAARGLDIPNIQHVVHYQVPTTAEDYIHRSGRTARADKEGLSVLIMESSEVSNFVKLQKTLGRNADMPIFPIDARIMQNVRERVRLAREIENLDLHSRRQNDNRNWKKKAADDIGILDSSEDSDDDNTNNRAQKQMNLAVKQKKFALGKLLSKNVMPSSVQSLKFPIGTISQVESTPIEAVKKLVAQKNGRQIKLYKSKSKK